MMHAAADSSADQGREFSRIFRDHAAYVWRVLRRLGVAEADVEDVCQEVFLVVLRKQAGFEGRSTTRTWIYGICIRVASDYRRRAHLRREIVTDHVPESSVSPSQAAALQHRQARRMLDAALDALDEDKRAVFVLYEIEELPMAEVAEVVGCPLQTAYSRLHAARRIVRAAIEEALERDQGGGAARAEPDAGGASRRGERS